MSIIQVKFWAIKTLQYQSGYSSLLQKAKNVAEYPVFKMTQKKKMKWVNEVTPNPGPPSYTHAF